MFKIKKKIFIISIILLIFTSSKIFAAPEPPSNLIFKEKTETNTTLEWEGSAESYIIYKNDSEFMEVDENSANFDYDAFEDNLFEVTAVDSDGNESEPSRSFNPDDSPYNLEASNIKDNSFDLTFTGTDRNTDLTHYKIYVNDERIDKIESQYDDENKEYNYEITDLKKDTQYDIYVSGYADENDYDTLKSHLSVTTGEDTSNDDCEEIKEILDFLTGEHSQPEEPGIPEFEDYNNPSEPEFDYDEPDERNLNEIPEPDVTDLEEEDHVPAPEPLEDIPDPEIPDHEDIELEADEELQADEKLESDEELETDEELQADKELEADEELQADEPLESDEPLEADEPLESDEPLEADETLE
ncbi:MAG: fibronectin type III domain-containing protein [Nanoarchaeota archaeon]